MAASAETTHHTPAYDLLLLLSLTAPEQQRTKILADVEKVISGAGGSLVRNDDWGRRPTAYQINHQAEAEYHLLQFDAPPQTIEELSQTLHITDGVLRFRVIKLRPGTPDAPSSAPPVVAAAAHPAPPSASQAAASEAPTEPGPELTTEGDGSAPEAASDVPEAEPTPAHNQVAAVVEPAAIDDSDASGASTSDG